MRLRTRRGRRDCACRRCLEHRLRLAKGGSRHQDKAPCPSIFWSRVKKSATVKRSLGVGYPQYFAGGGIPAVQKVRIASCGPTAGGGSLPENRPRGKPLGVSGK